MVLKQIPAFLKAIDEVHFEGCDCHHVYARVEQIVGEQEWGRLKREPGFDASVCEEEDSVLAGLKGAV